MPPTTQPILTVFTHQTGEDLIARAITQDENLFNGEHFRSLAELKRYLRQQYAHTYKVVIDGRVL